MGLLLLKDYINFADLLLCNSGKKQIMIEIKHLKKQYDMATPLIDVNTTINKGDVISIIGPSGTGKSTLLRCINMLEKPTDGHILINGEDVTNPKCDIRRIRMKLGMIFQSFNLYENLTAIENCMLAQTVLLKRSKQEAYDKAIELLTSVGMEKQALQYPFELSGGQKQRVAIARTLATDPETILFDEPTSALDPLSATEIEDVIGELKKQGRTMMIVTHSLDFAERISSRVFYMDQGIIYEEGTPEQIFKNPLKDRTRDFVSSSSSMDMLTTDENHDLDNEINKIYTFCKARNIDDKRIMHACGAYEEYYTILTNYSFKDNKNLYTKVEYDKNADKLMIHFTPDSYKDWNLVTDTVTNSLEYKLFSGYIKSFYEETDSDKLGRYTQHYEIK